MGNVVLIGFMGCGKSSVAVKLSYRLKRQMTDTDRLIEKKQGKSIREIFEQDGEEAFRQMETQTLQELKETAKNQVISVGGGTPVREENRTLMKEIGKVVYLRAKAETLYERLKKDTNRPLLQGGDEDLKTKIQGLLEKRSSAYEEAADLIIDVDDKPFGQVLYEIERGIRPSYRDNANTASEEGGYRGIRLVSALVMVQGRPTENLPTEHLALTDSLHPAAAFYPADVLRMMDTLKEIYRHWQTPVRQKKRPSPMDLSPMGSPLMGSRQRAVSSFTDSSFPVRRQKKKRKSLCASFWSSTVPT